MLMFSSWTVVVAQTPAPLSDSISERKICIDFPINSFRIDSTFSNNATNLMEVHQLLAEARTNPLMSLESLKVSGCASPDGSLPKNKELSRRRAMAVHEYLHSNCGVPDSLMQFGENTVSWNLFRRLISLSRYPWSAEALRIITEGSDNSIRDNATRMNRLKALDNGAAWKVIKRDMLPQLRSACVVTALLSIHQPDEVVPEVEVVGTEAEVVAEAPELKIIEEPTPTIEERTYDRFDIKTNAAYLAAGVTNIGAEMAVSDHWSIDLPLVYSPYTLARTYRMRFLYVQPEARYWFDCPLRGHFFGVHANVGVANVSFNRTNRFQTPHGFYGAGVSYGYSLPIAKRWSMEFTIGAGYFFTKYDTYHNNGIPVGQRYKKGTPLNYWGIDKLGINFVYRFGDKSGKVRKEVKL